MDCFQDFCLACDKQCNDRAYCSETCRLADLEKASSQPTTPLTPSAPSFGPQSWASSRFGTGSGYVLAPAFDFSERPTSQRLPTDSTAAQRSLTPSSSRASLSSTTSASSQGGNGISEQARLELQEYFTSFDQTRASKRRSSVR